VDVTQWSQFKFTLLSNELFTHLLTCSVIYRALQTTLEQLLMERQQVIRCFHISIHLIFRFFEDSFLSIEKIHWKYYSS
jgi:hypothetical protein